MDYIYKINGVMNNECIQFEISKNKANSSRFILRITTTAIVVFLALVCISAIINKNSFNNNLTYIFFTLYSKIYDPGIMLIFNETTHSKS